MLTISQAKLYFQYGNPGDWIGRSVVYEDSLVVSVTGIVKDWDQNTDLGFTDLISYSTLEHTASPSSLQDWTLSSSATNVYVCRASNVSMKQVEQQLKGFMQRHMPGNKARLALQPLADVHFNAAYQDTYGRRAHQPTLFALAGIALFILLIAAINFINLSTASSVMRAKEMGIRKVMGSSAGGIVGQMLIETIITVLAAMGLALLLAEPVLAALHGLIPEGVRLTMKIPGVLPFIAITVLVTCLLAGWYPGRVLASFHPVTSLRGQGAQQLNANSYLRKGLIVFQFTVSLVFIIGTMMVGRQISYMLRSDLGFIKDAIVSIDIPGGGPDHQKELLAAEMRRLAGVQRVSLNTADPASRNHYLFGTSLEYKGAATVKIMAAGDAIDGGYIPLFGLTILAGRNFQPADTAHGNMPATATAPAKPGYRAYILNETASRALGFRRPADAVGKQVESGMSRNIKGPIIGVVKDFHAEDMHRQLRPFIFSMDAGSGTQLSIRFAATGMSTGKVKTLITNMEAVYKIIYPGTVFQSRFFDESLEQLYTQERQTSQILKIAMGIAVFISCMGLFGLAAFNAQQRTREIGIRKVLGAGVWQLVSLLSRQFIVLVGLATLIAVPLAGWAGQQWLQQFAYRVSMPWWLFVLAGFAATLIALLTVSWQTIRTAMANPVKNLRVD